MSEANEIKNCGEVNAAYDAYCAGVSDDGYIRILEAMERCLREGGCAYHPVNMELLEQSLEAGKGRVAWSIRNTPAGRLLSVFTSEAQVQKHSAPSYMLALLKAFFDMVLESEQLDGMLLNPCDSNGGVVVPRNLVEMMAQKSGVYFAGPEISMDMISSALLALHGNCTGVPFPVLTVNGEVDAVGGAQKLVASVLDNITAEHEGTLIRDKYDLKSEIRWIVEDAMMIAGMVGWQVNEDKSFFTEKGPVEWYNEKTKGGEVCFYAAFEHVFEGMDCYDGDDFEDDVEDNAKAYVDILEENVGSAFKCDNKEQPYEIMENNIVAVVLGAILFGIGWGVALSCKHQGEESVKRMEALQEKYLSGGYSPDLGN